MMPICDRCGKQNEKLQDFFHNKFHLCMECSLGWIRFVQKHENRNEVTCEKDGEELCKKFAKGVWSVS